MIKNFTYQCKSSHRRHEVSVTFKVQMELWRWSQAQILTKPNNFKLERLTYRNLRNFFIFNHT